MKLLDAKGERLEKGDRVRTVTGEDRAFGAVMEGTVIEFRGGPPTVAVRLDDAPGLYRPEIWLGIDLMWRCPDLTRINPETEETNDAG